MRLYWMVVSVMVADPGAELSAYSVNHGAGRVMGRRNAYRTLDQREIVFRFRGREVGMSQIGKRDLCHVLPPQAARA